MIKYLSGRLASYLCQGDSTADQEVLAYGYELALQKIAVVAGSALIAIPLGLFLPVLLSHLLYNLLRRYAGGLHAPHRSVCIITSCLTLFGPSFLFMRSSLVFSRPALLLLWLADLLLLCRYAPAGTDTKPISNPSLRKTMKRSAIAVLCTVMAACVALSFWAPDYSSVFATIVTIVCLFTHPLFYWLFQCKRGDVAATANGLES